jgi:hypothetical protein
MTVGYLIAFMARPQPGFLPSLIALSREEGVEIKGALVTHGPGCYNLAFLLPAPNKPFVNALTVALMPARWTTTTDPQLKEGEFISLVESAQAGEPISVPL